MVRPVRRALPGAQLLLALLLVLPALLTGCGFFTASLFPGYLAQVEASFDLGPRVDDFLSGQDYPWHSEVFVLRTAAGVDYGAVLIGIENLPYKLLMLVGPTGGVRELSSQSLGRLHLTDASGRFVVGNLAFDPTTLPAFSILGITNYYALGFSAGTNNYLLWTDSATSNSLQFARYGAGWGGATNNSAQVDTNYGYELRGVCYDQGAAGKEVILVLFNYNYNRVVVLFTPAAGFDGTVTFLTPLLSNYQHLELENVDASNVLYTRKGIVVADWDGRAVLKDFSGADTGKGLDLGQRQEVRVAFDLEGNNFFAFNAEDRVLYRGKTGW
jgi:hypothetical protein